MTEEWKCNECSRKFVGWIPFAKHILENHSNTPYGRGFLMHINPPPGYVFTLVKKRLKA